MILATLYELILWSNGALNAQKWQFCAKLYFLIISKWQFFFQNPYKMTLKRFENEKIATSLRLVA